MTSKDVIRILNDPPQPDEGQERIRGKVMNIAYAMLKEMTTAQVLEFARIARSKDSLSYTSRTIVYQCAYTIFRRYQKCVK